MSQRSSTGSERPAAARARRRSPAVALAGRMLHLDAFSGIAGNMLLGAMIDAGLPQRTLIRDLGALDVPFQLVSRRVQRAALVARWVDVRVPRPRQGGRVARKPKAAASHAHAHPHAPTTAHVPHASGRRWTEIRRLLGRARLEPVVRDRAIAVFSALAEAEARVHGIPVEQVQFHEVGAVDAIVDIAGAAVGLHRLGVQRITCTPLPLGHGTVDTEHGRLPLPAPATLELLRGLPVVPTHLAWETVTPTGAAIVRTVVDEFCQLPAMTIEAIGLGAGNDRSGPLPNVLRAVIGRGEGFGADRVVMIECHVDDLNPEHFEYLMERLFEAGALDVALQHLQMKKNRPGFAIRVIAKPGHRVPLARVLFAESTTLGVRVAEAERIVLIREERRVATPFGSIRVKIVRDAAGRPTASAEYEDCKKAALRSGVPLREVVRMAEEAARATDPDAGSRGREKR